MWAQTESIQAPTMTVDETSSVVSNSDLSQSTCLQENVDEKFDMLRDRLAVMLNQESTTYNTYGMGARRCELPSSNAENPLTSDCKVSSTNDPWRQPMINWMFSVVDVFQLSPENVALAAYYLDRCDVIDNDFISCPTDYQLVSVTALQLAVKMLEYEIFPLSQLVKFLGNTFCERDIVNMELRMMEALDWHLNPPTPYTFLGYYLQLMPDDIPIESRNEIHDASCLLIRMAISNDMYLKFPPSVIAYASLIHAMERLGDKLPVDEKRIFALRLQEAADLTTESLGLRAAFAALASLQVQSHGGELAQVYVNPKSDGLNVEDEHELTFSPRSIVQHHVVHVPFDSEEQGIEIIPDFGYHEEAKNPAAYTVSSPRNVAEDY